MADSLARLQQENLLLRSELARMNDVVRELSAKLHFYESTIKPDESSQWKGIGRVPPGIGPSPYGRFDLPAPLPSTSGPEMQNSAYAPGMITSSYSPAQAYRSLTPMAGMNAGESPGTEGPSPVAPGSREERGGSFSSSSTSRILASSNPLANAVSMSAPQINSATDYTFGMSAPIAPFRGEEKDPLAAFASMGLDSLPSPYYQTTAMSNGGKFDDSMGRMDGFGAPPPGYDMSGAYGLGAEHRPPTNNSPLSVARSLTSRGASSYHGAAQYDRPAVPSARPYNPMLHPDDFGKDLSSMRCRNCGQYGHIMRYCKMLACFHCGQQGHMASVCPHAARRTGGYDGYSGVAPGSATRMAAPPGYPPQEAGRSGWSPQTESRRLMAASFSSEEHGRGDSLPEHAIPASGPPMVPY